jgi:hypothetical protein
MKQLVLAWLACAGCEKPETRPPLPPSPVVDLPVVEAGLPRIATGSHVVLAKQILAIAGAPPMPFHGPAEVDDVRAAAAQLDGTQPVALAIDRQTSYALLGELVDAIHDGAHATELRLIARSGGDLVAAAIVVPNLELPRNITVVQAGKRPVGDEPTPGNVDLAVFLREGRIRVASLTNQEGSVLHPALDVPRGELHAVATKLAEIVRRHWSTASRPAADRRLVIFADDETTVQELASLLAVTTPAFPETLLHFDG